MSAQTLYIMIYTIVHDRDETHQRHVQVFTMQLIDIQTRAMLIDLQAACSSNIIMQNQYSSYSVCELMSQL